MNARSRVAALLAFVVLGLGVGAGVEANAAPATTASTATPATSTNGCVVVPSLNLAVCLGRF